MHWWWRRWRQRIDRSLHQTIFIQRKIVVSVSSDQRKRGSTCAVHRSFSCFAPSPTQVHTSDPCREHKRFLGGYACFPSHIRRIQHAMRFGILDERLHCCVYLGRSILLYKIALPRFVACPRLFWIILTSLLLSIIL